MRPESPHQGRRRILFVHNGTGLGGAPKSLRYIIETCRDGGYSCSVACLKCPETNPYFAEAGAKLIVVDSLPSFTNSTSASFEPGSREFREERVRSQQYTSYWREILRTHGPFELVFINSMRLCDLIAPSREAGSRVIQVVRETAQPGSSLEVMKGIIGQADTVIFISEYDRDLFSIATTKTVVLPNAEKPEDFEWTPDERAALRAQLGLGDDETAFLFTGGDDYIKGGDLMLEAFLEVRPSCQLSLLFGGYAHEEEAVAVKALVKRVLCHFGSSRRLQRERVGYLLERVTRRPSVRVVRLGFSRQISKYYKAADVCIVPYRVPHQARPIFEAGFAKVPCLVSDFPCFQYEIAHGDNGLTLPPFDPDAWARAIEQLAEDPHSRHAMGERNYQRAIERHDLRRNAKSLLAIVAAVLGEHEPVARAGMG